VSGGGVVVPPVAPVLGEALPDEQATATNVAAAMNAAILDRR